MGKIISVIGCKGGCGATTLTSALGHELSALGNNVCLVDGCIGLRALDIMLRVQDKAVYDFYDLCECICTMDQALIQVKPLLHSLSAPQVDVSRDLDANQLHNLMIDLKKRFEYVLIDAPDVFSSVCEKFYLNSDENILITLPGDIAGRNLERIGGLIREKTDTPVSCIFNFTQPHSKQAEKLQGLTEYLDIPILGMTPFYEAVFLEPLDHRAYSAYPGKIKAAMRDAAMRLNEGSSMNNQKTRRLPWRS